MRDFKTIQEQIDILYSRGLKFNDYSKAKKYLLTNNYYNVINGYSKYFMNTQKTRYINNATFDEITHVHFFDKEVKSILFKSIIQAESHIKYILAHRFSEYYPNKKYAYLDVNSYDDSKILDVGWLISRLSKIINDNVKRNNGNSIRHYVRQYDDVPMWVLVDYLDFGEMNTLIKNLPTKLQNKIAKNLCTFISDNIAIQVPFTPEIMMSFINNIREVRNVCAHNNRLLGFKCRGDVKYYSDLHAIYGISLSDPKRDVYSIFIFLQCFLSQTQYAQLHNSFFKRSYNLEKKLQSISINTIMGSLGFPTNWNKFTPKLTQK